MPRLGEFDGAIGSHLLHYAPDAAHLRGRCDSVADDLVPGGRFVTFKLNPDLARRPDRWIAPELSPEGWSPLSYFGSSNSGCPG